MRLIDADKFKGKVIASHTGSGVIKLIAIDEVLTAYDTDKVVEQLEEYREEMEQFKCGGMLSDMIEVVKAGGVNGKKQS